MARSRGVTLCPFTLTSASVGGLFFHTVFCGGLSEKSLKASERSTEHPDTQCSTQVWPPAVGPLAVSLPAAGPLPLAVPAFLVPGIKQDRMFAKGEGQTKPGAGTGTSGMGWAPSSGQENGSEEGSELMPGRWPCWKGWGKAREKPQWGERPGATEMGPLLLVPGFEALQGCWRRCGLPDLPAPPFSAQARRWLFPLHSRK